MNPPSTPSGMTNALPVFAVEPDLPDEVRWRAALTVCDRTPEHAQTILAALGLLDVRKTG